MGITTQRSYTSLLSSKYSFPHPRSHLPHQISLWKFSQEELQQSGTTGGDGLIWPFKIYSDEGYIIALVENHSVPIDTKKIGKKGELTKASIEVIQLLYLFWTGEVEEYYVGKVKIETNNNKFVVQQLSLTVYVYVGEHLSSIARLRLLEKAISLQRYLGRGGLSAVAKIYHDYESLANINNQIVWRGDEQAQNGFMAQISSLIDQKIKSIETKQERDAMYLQQMNKLNKKLSSFHLLRKILFFTSIGQKSKDLQIVKESEHKIYKKVSMQRYENLAINLAKQKQKQEKKVLTEKKNLDDSMPFQCEITEINLEERRAKWGKQVEAANDSLFEGEALQVLGENNPDFIKITCDEQDFVILGDYRSAREYSKLIDFNVRLIVNLGAGQCYNYFLNDFDYKTVYLNNLPNLQPPESLLWLYNVESQILDLTEAIVKKTTGNKKGDPMNGRVFMYSATGIFSDEACAFVAGYLIVRHLYTLEKALGIILHCYRDFKRNKDANWQLHRIYREQLQTLEERILSSNFSNYKIAKNPNLWRAYQLGPCGGNLLAPTGLRYVGSLSNANQLQALPVYQKQIFVLISQGIASSYGSALEKWQKDPTIKPVQNLGGIKILYGKQCQFKQESIKMSKQGIPLAIKWEILDRGKHKNNYNNDFFLKFIEVLVENNLQTQLIEKSFRKPQPFAPLMYGLSDQATPKPIVKRVQPYSPRQKLIFKYPYLRPTWEGLKDDQYYFLVGISKNGANVQIVKGCNWIGLEDDKQTFFQNIVRVYLQNIDEEKIWITQEEQDSLFADQLPLD